MEQLKKSIDAAQEILGAMLGVKRKLSDAFGKEEIDRDMYTILNGEAQGMETKIRAYITYQEREYKRAGGYFYDPATRCAKPGLRYHF